MMYSLILVLIIGATTQLLRFLPFLIFSKNTPDSILYLGKVLPYAIMAMLVVYCLRNTNFMISGHGVSEFISVISVVLLHKWRHNTLLSILFGTLIYMFMVQVVF